MTYTRLTVVGSARKAELALPAEEPVALLLPQVLELLDEPPKGGLAMTLTTLTGEVLDADASLDEQGVRPGTLLRVTAVDDAPQQPEVVDVTDAIADASAARRDAWTSAHARLALAVVGGVASACSATWAMTAFTVPGQWMLVVVVALAVIGAVLARTTQQPAAIAFAAAGLGVAMPAATRFAVELPAATGAPGVAPATPLLIASAAAWLVLGIVWGVGFARASARIGAAVGLLTSGTLFFLAIGGVDQGGTAIVAGVLSVAALGLLPGAAISLSGLTAFDDRTMRGERASTRDVRLAVGEAFAQLTWTVVALAVVAVTALTQLLLSADPWQQGLAAALALVVLLRTRTFPLLAPRIALCVAVAVPTVLWLFATPLLGESAKALAGAALAGTALACAAWHPSDVVTARLRKAAEVAELLIVLSVVPLALGAFGIFADLLEAFS